MQVIGFFGDVLRQVGALWQFITQPLDIFSSLGLGDVSILTLLSTLLVTLLVVSLGLHIVHLVNPVG